MRNKIFFIPLLAFLLTSCFSLETSRDYTKYGKTDDYISADFSIDEDLEVYYRYESFAFTYDGLTYIKCKNVEPDSIKGPWTNEKSAVFESFLNDFYSIYDQFYADSETSVVVNPGLKRDEYGISLKNEYWFYYMAKEDVNIGNYHHMYIENENIDYYREFEYFTAYCYLPVEKDFIMLTAAQFRHFKYMV